MSIFFYDHFSISYFEEDLFLENVYRESEKCFREVLHWTDQDEVNKQNIKQNTAGPELGIVQTFHHEYNIVLQIAWKLTDIQENFLKLTPFLAGTNLASWQAHNSQL